MSPNDGLWQEGRLAWERLAAWYAAWRAGGPAEPSSRPVDGSGGSGGGPGDDGAVHGDDAVSALADIGLARRLLDQTELAAVRAARRGGKSWSEIATALGVTRQSAWERWRDLDDVAGPEPATAIAGPVARPEGPLDAEKVAAEISKWAARRMRRQSSVAVPSVIGVTWDYARVLLSTHGLFPIRADPDLPPPSGSDGASFVVTDQSPESGARVALGSSVRLWLERGGGSGVREPRRPKPGPRTGRAAVPEPDVDALG
jgi:hypothetical protein